MKRVLHRCSFPTLGEPKCSRTARWCIVGYYDGRLQFVMYACLRHLEQWKEMIERSELSQEWRFEIRRLSS
jgi:hypothetical protein